MDITLSAIQKGGRKKQLILREMLYADLGIKDVRVIGSKENSEIEAVHRLVSEEGIETEYSLRMGQESRNAEVFFRGLGCGWKLYKMVLCWW